MKQFVLTLAALLLFAVPAWAQWDAGFELRPPDTESIGLADNNMREIKTETRSRDEVEHCFSTIVGGASCDQGSAVNITDNGRHREGSARAFNKDAMEPGTLETTDFDNGGGAGTDVLDDGRLWVDTNSTPADNVLSVYNQTAGAWQAVSAVTGDEIALDDEILAGSYNLVYNGSFEATDGTGGTASVLIPEGWVAIGDGTFAYDAISDDLTYGYGYHVEVSSVAGGGGISQTLTVSGVGTYKVMARVSQPNDADICRLTTSGATTAESGDLDHTTLAWGTLSGTFTTIADDAVEIQLITVAAGTTCDWDHVTVYRIDDVTADRDEISQPGLVVLFDDNTGAAQTIIGWVGYGGITGLDDLTVVTPGPGYVITVVGMIIFENSPNSTPVSCDARITQNAAAVSFGAWQWAADSGKAVRGTVSMQYVNNAPVPGATYTYALEAIDSLPDRCRTDAASDPSASLMVRVEPTR